MLREAFPKLAQIFHLPARCRSNTDNANCFSRLFAAPRPIPLATLLFLFLLISEIAIAGQTQKQLHGVILSDGRAVKGATVAICDLHGTEIGSAATDDSGEFVIITDAAPGEYVLLVAQGRQLVDKRVVLNQIDFHIKVAVTAAPANVLHSERYAVSSQQLRIPAKARKHIAAAQLQFSRLNLPGAVRELDLALKVDPTCADALSMRAFVKLAAKDILGAVEDARHAVMLNSGNADAYLALGTAYNSSKNFERAEEALRHALALRPDSWQVQLELAKTWYGQKRFVLALRELQMIERDFPDVHLVRANVLMSLGRRDEGAEEFNAFLRQAPDDPRRDQVERVLAAVQSSISTAPRQQ